MVACEAIGAHGTRCDLEKGHDGAHGGYVLAPDGESALHEVWASCRASDLDSAPPSAGSPMTDRLAPHVGQVRLEYADGRTKRVALVLWTATVGEPIAPCYAALEPDGTQRMFERYGFDHATQEWVYRESLAASS